jgi:DNA (cytosine-5)-methyltransferase 1
VIAFSKGDHGADAGMNVCPTIRKGGDGGGNMPAIAFEWQRGATQNLELTDNFSPALIKSQTPAVAFEANMSFATPDTSGVNPTLTRRHYASVAIASAVRRLTPRECERLQGFADDWTLIPYRNKPADQCPDGPRYKALGNSMAVPVMRWIGQRIQMVENMIRNSNG